jgi:hypothetical protein
MSVNYEVLDLNHNLGKTILNGRKVSFQISHLDSVNGVYLLLAGTATGAACSVQFAGSVKESSNYVNIGAPLTLTGSFANEIELTPAVNTTLRPFIRATFTVPSGSTLVIPNFNRTKRG